MLQIRSLIPKKNYEKLIIYLYIFSIRIFKRKKNITKYVYLINLFIEIVKN